MGRYRVLFDGTPRTRSNNSRGKLQFGKKSDVALRRTQDGGLNVDSKYVRVKGLRIGDIEIEDFIERAIRKRALYNETVFEPRLNTFASYMQ